MLMWAKRLTITTLGLILLAVLAIVSVPLWLDPNTFKDDLETLASEKGLALTVDGDIRWQFFPVFGLSVNGLSLAPLSAPSDTMASAKSISAAVAVAPLLQRQIQITNIQLIEANGVFIKDAKGNTNWDPLLSQFNTDQPNKASSQEVVENTNETVLSLQVDQIRVDNAGFRYTDKQNNVDVSLDTVFIEFNNVNTNENPFPFSIYFHLDEKSLPSKLPVELTGQIASNNSFSSFEFHNVEVGFPTALLSLMIDGDITTTPNLNYNLSLQAQLDNIKLLYTTLGYWPSPTRDPTVISKANFQVAVNGSPEQIELSSINFTIDDTTLTGNTTITLATSNTPLRFVSNIQGNQINIDRYLAPVSETNEPESANDETNTPLPLEELRSVNGQFALQFSEVIFNNLPITELQLSLSGNNGLWQINPLQADFYQGKLAAQGTVNARDTAAQIEWQADATNIDVNGLLKDVAEIDVLSGNLTGNIAGQSTGKTNQDLIDNLVATLAFSGEQLQLRDINIEQQYCRIIEAIKAGETSDQVDTIDWPTATAFKQVVGQASLIESVATLDNFQAQVAYLLIAARGKVDIDTQDYDITFPITLTREQTSESGCLVASNFLINREINVLACDGELETLDPSKQCGLRDGAIGDLAKKAVRYNLSKEKNQEKIEDAKDNIDEKKQELRQRAKDRLRDLLNR